MKIMKYSCCNLAEKKKNIQLWNSVELENEEMVKLKSIYKNSTVSMESLLKIFSICDD